MASGVDWRRETRRAARLEGIDPDLFEAQIEQESGFDEDVIFGRRVSSAGAQGIAQMMPATARGWGVNPLKPRKALRVAARNMRGYIEKYGVEGALRAYNAGPGNIERSKEFDETNTYVRNIMGKAGRTNGTQRPQGGRGAGRGGSGRGGAQAPAQAAQALDLGASSDIVTTLAAALQTTRQGAGVGASAPALPATAARPVSAAAMSPAAGVAPLGARSSIGAKLQQVLATVDTTPVTQARAAGGARGGGRAQEAGVQGRTLYIGDSLGVGTAGNLKKLLGGHVDADVVGGRSSEAGIAALKQKLGTRGYRNIVLDLGTNDMTADQLARSVQRARKLAPAGVQIFIPTLNGPFATKRKNEVLRKIAARDERITLVPWHAKSEGRLADDGTHATAQGYEARARLIARRMGWAPPAQQQGGAPRGVKGPLLEMFYRGPGGVNIDQGKVVGRDFVDGHEGHVHVAAAPRVVIRLGKIAQQRGLTVRENPAFDPVDPVHTDGSFHYSKRAIDVSGEADELRRFNRDVARWFGIDA